MIKDRQLHHGQAAVTPSEKRTHCVSVRVSYAELASIDARRGGQRRGAWMRSAAIGNLPPIVPELNREAWVKLARSAANLNQLMAHLNAASDAKNNDLVHSIDAIRSLLTGFRNALLGHFEEGASYEIDEER